MLKEIIDHGRLHPADQSIPDHDIRPRFAVLAAQATPNFNLGVKLVLANEPFNDVDIEVVSARKA